MDRLLLLCGARHQLDLARILGLSPDAVSKWAKGKTVPRLSLLERVALEHGVDWQWLLTGKSADLRMLIEKIYGRLAPKEVVDADHYALAREMAGWAAIRRCGEIRPDPTDPDFTEAANRLYFLATHRVESFHWPAVEPDTGDSIVETQAHYLLTPRVGVVLREAGYGGYDRGREVIESLLAHYSPPDEGLIKSTPEPVGKNDPTGLPVYGTLGTATRSLNGITVFPLTDNTAAPLAYAGQALLLAPASGTPAMGAPVMAKLAGTPEGGEASGGSRFIFHRWGGYGSDGRVRLLSLAPMGGAVEIARDQMTEVRVVEGVLFRREE